MQHFYYSFVLTLFHSLWQALLLLMGFYVVLLLNKNTAPLLKRNLLFGTLGLQLLITVSSFFIIYFSPNFSALPKLLPGIQNLNSQAEWPLWLFIGYLILLGFKIGSLFSSYNKLRLLKKENVLKVSAELKIFTQQKAFLLGIKKPVTIAYHKYISTPLTYGFLKPVILLPFSMCNSISMAEAETLVLHELTHIKNKDYLLNLFLPWVENIFFFNPFIQIIIKNIRLEREKSCDWQVLQFNYDPISYAEVLLQTAKQPQQKQNIFLAAVNKSSELLKRIQFFSNPKNITTARTYTNWIAIPLFFAILILSLLLLTPKQTEINIADNAKNELALFTDLEVTELASPETEYEAMVNNISEYLPNNSTIATEPIDVVEPLPTEDFSEPTNNNLLVIDSLSLTVQHYDLIPVSFAQADSLITREVTVTEEFSGGEKVTKTYLVRLVKGEWQAAPLWMIKEIPPITDSSKVVLKDSLAPLQISVKKDSIQ